MLALIGKRARSCLKIDANLFNQLSLTRREQFIKFFSEKKGCKQIIKRLQPSDKLLFGGKLTETAKNMHASDQLTILTGGKKPSGYGNGGGGNYSSRGRGHKNPGRGGKGPKVFKGSRASRFGNAKKDAMDGEAHQRQGAVCPVWRVDNTAALAAIKK